MHLQLQLFVYIILLFTIVCSTIDVKWDYQEFGPDVWSETYPSCSGHSQSPINIRTACTTYQSFVPFSFSLNYDITQNVTLTNNGHTVIGTYSGSNSSALTLTGGNLNGTFEFVNFHLHWGENYKSGSEHQVNGKKYAGEIHFVHLNRKTNQTTALGILMQSTRDTIINKTTYTRKNTANATLDEWGRYFSSAKQLQETDNSTVVNLNLRLLMGTHLNEFWRYQGSLTTPPCTEGIIWTIFETPIILNESEINSLRKNIFVEDYRGPQPLYNRTVYRNFLTETVSTISDYNCCLKDSNSSAHKTFIRITIQLFSYFFLFIIIF